MRVILIMLTSFILLPGSTNAEEKPFYFSIFGGFNEPLRPLDFRNYYLAGTSIGVKAGMKLYGSWFIALSTEYTSYNPDVTFLLDRRLSGTEGFVPDDAAYTVKSYSLTGILERRWGNPREDIHYYTELELGPHLFKGWGWESIPKELRKEATLSVGNVLLGYGVGAGIIFDLNERYATFIGLSWHRLLRDVDSKGYMPLTAGVRF